MWHVVNWRDLTNGLAHAAVHKAWRKCQTRSTVLSKYYTCILPISHSTVSCCLPLQVSTKSLDISHGVFTWQCCMRYWVNLDITVSFKCRLLVQSEPPAAPRVLVERRAAHTSHDGVTIHHSSCRIPVHLAESIIVYDAIRYQGLKTGPSRIKPSTRDYIFYHASCTWFITHYNSLKRHVVLNWKLRSLSLAALGERYGIDWLDWTIYSRLLLFFFLMQGLWLRSCPFH